MAATLLEIKNLQKRFPGVVALAGVDFNVRSGEIHALMGENGAGKSTLIKVLTGVHRRDGGEILFLGNAVQPSAPIEAEAIGISTVYQEVNLIPHLSVAENIALGRQPKRWGMIDGKSMRSSARRTLGRLGLDLDVRREASSYSVAIQQMIAIARAIDLNAKLLILDEPTSSLDETEVDELFAVMERLREQGLGIIFVTHFLDQVYRITDRITVLRNGTLVGEFDTERLDRFDLVSKMLGKEREVTTPSAVTPPAPSEPGIEQAPEKKTSHANASKFLDAKHIARRGTLEPIDLSIRAGEVVGLAGLLGSGRTELARLIFGLDRMTSGHLTIDGQTVKGWSPRQAIDAGIAYCPEDRKIDGVIAQLSVRENILLAMQASRSIARTLPRRRQNDLANHYVSALSIKTPSIETPVGTLSGGNQQKVLLARWLAMAPKLIILDEPTRGIDVGAKAEIENLVNQLQTDGMAVLFISSELEEVIRVCQRVAVLRDRKLVGELSGSSINEPTIMKMIAQSNQSSHVDCVASDQSRGSITDG